MRGHLRSLCPPMQLIEQRAFVLTASLLAASCAGGSPDASTAETRQGQDRDPTLARTRAPELAERVDEPAPVDPWRGRLRARVLASSGLGPGTPLLPFPVLATDGDEPNCVPCGEPGKPMVIAIGSVDDEAFRNDLLDLDAIVHKYEGAITAVGVLAELRDGRVVSSTPAEAEATLERARAFARALRVTIPVVVPAASDATGNDVWGEYYNVTASRTIMLSNVEGKSRFTAVGPDDWSEIDAALRELLAVD